MSVLLPRSAAIVITALAALIVAVSFSAAAAADFAVVLDGVGRGEVFATVPLDERALGSMVASWQGTILAVGPGSADVAVAGVNQELADPFSTAALAELITAVIVAALVSSACIGVLIHRLRWRALSWLSILTGIVLGLGSVVTELLSTTAAEALSIWLYAADGPWMEPGFGFGIAIEPILAAVALVLFGASLRATGRFAGDADGVV